MNEDVQIDAQQAEETAETSSVENQTEETTQDASQEDSNQTSDKSIPYDRFQEVINSKNELKKEIEALKQQMAGFQTKKEENPSAPSNPQEEVVKQQLDKYLKELGYVSKQELEQKEADRQLETHIESLSKKYDGKDGRPKFDKSKVLEYAQSNLIGNLEIAYKQMNEAALLDFAIKQAMGKTKGVKTEVSDGSGSAQVGTTQGDLIQAANSGDKDALATLIKRAL